MTRRARLLELADRRVPRFYRQLAERASRRELEAHRFACSNGAHCPGRREHRSGWVGAAPAYFAVLYFHNKREGHVRLEPRILLLCRTCAGRFAKKHQPDPAPRSILL